MTELANPELRTATKTHGDAEKTLDAVSVNYWSADAHSRIYVNDLFTATTDVYVDLAEKTLTVSGTKTRNTDVQADDGTLTLTIERPSATYELVIEGAETEDTKQEQDAEDGDESDVDLESLGVSL